MQSRRKRVFAQSAERRQCFRVSRVRRIPMRRPCPTTVCGEISRRSEHCGSSTQFCGPWWVSSASYFCTGSWAATSHHNDFNFGWSPFGRMWMDSLLPIAFFSVIVSVCCTVLTGYALMTRQPWGRILAIVFSIFACFTSHSERRWASTRCGCWRHGSVAMSTPHFPIRSTVRKRQFKRLRHRIKAWSFLQHACAVCVPRPALRSLVRETHLQPSALIYPLFVCEGEGVAAKSARCPACSTCQSTRC